MQIKWNYVAIESLDSVMIWSRMSALALFPIAISAGVFVTLTGVNITNVPGMAENYLILTLYITSWFMFFITLGRIIGIAIDKALERLHEKRKAKRLAAEYQYNLNE